MGKKSGHPPSFVLAGYALLPARASNNGRSPTLALELEIDTCNMRIIDVACDNLPALGEKFLRELLVGKKVEEGLKQARQEIRERYSAVTQKAVIASIEDLLRRYREFQKRKAGANDDC